MPSKFEAGGDALWLVGGSEGGVAGGTLWKITVSRTISITQSGKISTLWEESCPISLKAPMRPSFLFFFLF